MIDFEYHFDEGRGDVMADASGNGHQGSIHDGEWVPGIAAVPRELTVAEANRRAVEWAINVGGTVTLMPAGGRPPLKSIADLPAVNSGVRIDLNLKRFPEVFRVEGMALAVSRREHAD